MIYWETGNVILKEYSPNGSLRPVISPRESRGRKRKHGARKYEDFSHPSHFHSIPLMSSFPQDEGSLSLSWEAGPLQDVSQCFLAKLFGEAFPQKMSLIRISGRVGKNGEQNSRAGFVLNPRAI